VATAEVYRARAELAELEAQYNRATGVYRTRREHVRFRLEKAEAEERRMKEEADRIEYTLRAAFGISLGQQSLMPPPPIPGGKVTFIQKTSPTELRRRLKELREKLREAPDSPRT
jgi:outer membrane protein TolC